MALVNAGVTDQGVASTDAEGVTTISDKWAIVFDAITDTMDDAFAALPVQYTSHPDLILATVDTRSVTRTSPKTFEGKVNYSHDPKQSSKSDPLSWQKQWSLGFESREDAFEQDFSDPKKDVKNTAQDWYENQPTKATNLAVLSVEYNLLSMSLSLVQETIGKTNNGSFLGQGAETVWCRAIRGNGPNTIGDTDYASITVEFVMDRDKHVIKLLSQGYNEELSGVKTAIKAADGRKITSPSNLLASGEQTTGDAHITTFIKYEKTNFAVFGLTISDLIGLSA